MLAVAQIERVKSEQAQLLKETAAVDLAKLEKENEIKLADFKCRMAQSEHEKKLREKKLELQFQQPQTECHGNLEG